MGTFWALVLCSVPQHSVRASPGHGRPRAQSLPFSPFSAAICAHWGPRSSSPQSESSWRTGALGSHVGVLGKRPHFDEQNVFIAGGQRRLSQKISVSSTRQAESHPDCKSLASRWGRSRWARWSTSCLFLEGAEFPDVPLETRRSTVSLLQLESIQVGSFGVRCRAASHKHR